MSIDINKIIQESVQATVQKEKESEIETLEESNEIKTSVEKTEETPVQESFDPAVASAISAGLGALTFRNRVRSLNEQSSRGRRIAKGIGAGLGATAAGLGTAYAAGEGDTIPERIASGGRRGWDFLKDRFTGGTGGTGDQQPTSSDIQQPDRSHDPQVTSGTPKPDRSHDPQVTSGTPKPDPVAQGTAVDRSGRAARAAAQSGQPAPEIPGPATPQQVTSADLRRFRPGMTSGEISREAGIAPETPGPATPQRDPVAQGTAVDRSGRAARAAAQSGQPAPEIPGPATPQRDPVAQGTAVPRGGRAARAAAQAGRPAPEIPGRLTPRTTTTPSPGW